jgi:plastocyanin
MRGVRIRVLVGLAALSVLAAACGDDANDAGGSMGAGPTGATAATGATDSGDDPGAGSLYGGSNGMTGATGATGASGAKDADVSVSLNNYLFDPGTVKVGGGDVVAVRNGNARTPHTFTVVGEDVDLELAPLTTETVTIDLAPGTYQLICRFHESLGMTATLKVS